MCSTRPCPYLIDGPALFILGGFVGLYGEHRDNLELPRNHREYAVFRVPMVSNEPVEVVIERYEVALAMG